MPHLQEFLKQSLHSNWEEGLYNSNELLKYSLQVTTVIECINEELTQIPKEEIIGKIAQIDNRSILRFCSVCINNILKKHFWDSFFILPRSVRERLTANLNTDLRLDLPHHSIAAGFYLMYSQQLSEATLVFEKNSHIPYGNQIYTLSYALNLCNQATEFKQISSLILPPCPETEPEKRFHPTSWQAIQAFNRVIEETQLIERSSSRGTRAKALVRAQGELQHIINNIDQLAQPEGMLIILILQRWLRFVIQIASDIGNVEILEPVQNPYTIGDPVEGDRFVGREDILRELESLWLGAANPPSVLIYGHRRMGKSSILRNLTGGSDLKLIYVNLQLLGSVTQGISEVLLTIADDIAQHLDIAAPSDEAFLTFPQRTFERYLRDVLKQLDCRALIIALDEFEIIEDLIEAGQLTPDFMGYLRGLMQMDKRLAFALAGLHTLEEMTRDYFQPFFGSTYALRVGFLSSAATRQILENPSEDFPLEYHPDAVDEIYRLTHGQPYLVQLIGFQLVRRFNELMFETPTFISTSLNERISTPLNERNARLTLEDVAAVTDITQGDLFRNGRYYFDGIWNQASQDPPGQTDILKALAPHPTGLTTEQLQSQCPPVPDLTAALETLKRHDVINQTGERWQIQVELCRRWIATRT
ncbi:AAA family ATPase [Roseofilum capinflatum]|uniref:AAA family ATPase n=1 Tax=Roseofilum capinflatum BLCC-M114 TaxID=3022440 RepID=A0ABT7B1S8_9CYAN|nr:AAA family ATPase [Roseofilum capinflatum]MDJ1173118.1 AAA family ATPase [Roseofilum capinflatum BLCC-M114]